MPKQGHWKPLQLARIAAAPLTETSVRRIIPYVARGWESKSVESQQDDAKSVQENRARLTPEERSIASRKEGLELSRSRVLEQLRSAENPRYRKLLEESLAMLDQQITQLG